MVVFTLTGGTKITLEDHRIYVQAQLYSLSLQLLHRRRRNRSFDEEERFSVLRLELVVPFRPFRDAGARFFFHDKERRRGYRIIGVKSNDPSSQTSEVPFAL
jgi:hypothetical protein